MHLLLLDSFFKQVHNFQVDVIGGDANAAAYKYYKRQKYQDLHNSSVVVTSRERRNVRSTRDVHLKAGFALIMAVLSCRKPAGPRIMRKLWSNLCEQGNEQKLKENILFFGGIESQLRATARRIYSKSDVDNPMIAPRDYDVRQSGRVLELHKTDLWFRPTDLSLHFTILVTLREEL